MLKEIYSNQVAAILVIRINEKEFCFDMDDIYTIINPFRLNSNNHLSNLKVINYESMDIPIIDFASLFSMTNTTGIDNRILVLKKENQSLGFYVDQIVELITFNSEKKENLNLSLEVSDNPYLIGRVLFKNRLLIFPDTRLIFSNSFSK